MALIEFEVFGPFDISHFRSSFTEVLESSPSNNAFCRGRAVCDDVQMGKTIQEKWEGLRRMDGLVVVELGGQKQNRVIGL